MRAEEQSEYPSQDRGCVMNRRFAAALCVLQRVARIAHAVKTK
jgi:hypothetical protein